MDFSKINKKNEVYYLTKENPEFSKHYLEVRKKENRILTDSEVLKLPNLKLHEWKLRKKSTKRFQKYISNKKSNLKILDVGCGNGWFSNKIASISENNQIIGVDINSIELEQAVRVFKKNNLHFVYADIFKISNSFDTQFDIVILNGSIQYFHDFKIVIELLESFLKPEGEIHILDSPFYDSSQIKEAKKRTVLYYTKIGFPEMANQYFHHALENLSDFTILYRPKKTILDKILSKKDSPFMWLIKK